MSKSKLFERLGQFFMIGFKGKEPSPEFLEFVSEEQIGGIILFEENCGSYDVLKENIKKIKASYRDMTPLIAVDQEGGRVCRIKGMPAEYHSASYYASGKLLEKFAEDYAHSALYMESVGISLNLAPVADIFLDEDNDCLRDRCFGRTAEEVSAFVEKSIEVSHRSGLLCCLKHFPGLGSADTDPHLAVPVVSIDEPTWLRREMIPFMSGVEKGVDFVMTTHMLMSKIDDKIVTESENVINKLLREQIGFEGPVISDALDMNGAAALGEPGERAVKAFRAGHDILLFGQDFEDTVEAFDYFVRACRDGDISEERLESAQQRISGIKLKLDSNVLQ